MNENTKWMVRVSCMTYNHYNYITDALNGFVMQQTSFPFVCTIIDDASTDCNVEVIRHYVSENFELQASSDAYEKDTDYGHVTFARHKTNKNCFFAIIYLKENHYSQKKSKAPYLAEWMDTKYIALCEGDDYWTDSQKLQKQVEFMEEHAECSVCSHRFNVYDQNSNRMESDWLSSLFFKNGNEGLFYSNKENYNIWITQPMTTLYRNGLISRVDLNKYTYSCDIHLYYHLLKSGKGYCFPFVGAVYRKHDGGIDSPFAPKERAKMAVLKYGDLFHFNQEDKDLEKYYKNTLDLFCYHYVIQKIGEREKRDVMKDLSFILKEYRVNCGMKGWWSCLKKVVHVSINRAKK